MFKVNISRRKFVELAVGAAAASAIKLQEPAAETRADDAIPTENISESGNAPHPLGQNKHLFIDNWLTSQSRNVTLSVNPPERKGLVLIADKPWERGGITCYANAFWDDAQKEFKLYYSPIVVKPDQKFCLALATSRNGISWEKPSLGAVERDGSKDNNIVVDNQREGTVFIDPNAPAERKYAYLSSDPQGCTLFTSPDGIHFKPDAEKVSTHHSDSQISTFWDDQRKKYVHFFKVINSGKNDWYMSPKIQLNSNIPFPQSEPLSRATGRIECTTMDQRWDKPFLVVLSRDERDPSNMDLYTNSCQKYALAPDVYFGFPTPYYHWSAPNRKYLNAPTLKAGGKTNDGILETQLAVSRNGVTWTRLRVPYVPVHCEDGLDIKVAMAVPGMLYHPDRIDHFYSGYAFTHGDTQARDRLNGRAMGGIFRLSQRIDGFTSADFAYSGGSLTTRPFIFDGSCLYLNVNTSASGEGRVAILDESGKPIEGFGVTDCHYISGDYLRTMVQWNKGSDVSALAGKPVRLAFEMRGTKLFSFQFGSPEQA